MPLQERSTREVMDMQVWHLATYLPQAATSSKWELPKFA